MLAELTTLRLGGPARELIEATTRDELYDAVRSRDLERTPTLVLGGGSNVVVADAGFDGSVVRVCSQGVRVDESAASTIASVVVEAGVDWDAFVDRAIASGWAGVEALSGIPGLVGAVPIQNVGAYGQEVAQTISAVHCWDRTTDQPRTLSSADCEFGYRTSAFKRDPERWVVGAVEFRFARGSLGAPVEYEQVATALGCDLGSRLPASEVRAAVLGLRRGKGMVLDADDRDTWSAGSFFVNPVLNPGVLPPGAPAYDQPDGRVKTSAAWLVERAGFGRGYGYGAARISGKHTLALTNRGGATTAELLDLAREIVAGVRDTFGVTLVPEPRLVGCAL